METKYLTEKSYSLSRDADRLRTDANKILKENEVMHCNVWELYLPIVIV